MQDNAPDCISQSGALLSPERSMRCAAFVLTGAALRFWAVARPSIEIPEKNLSKPVDKAANVEYNTYNSGMKLWFI